MKINRTYFQKSLKNNFIVQNVYLLYIYILAKKFLANRSNWKSLQLNKLYQMLDYSKRHTIYYKRLLKSISVKKDDVLNVLESMPTLDKSIIREQGKEIYSDEIADSWKLWLNTGGSTGEPLKFPALYHSLPFEAINQMMLYVQMGYCLGDTIVSFGGNRVPKEERNRNVYWGMRCNFPYGKVKYSTLYLDQNTIMYYYKSFCEMKPDFVRGYSSGIISFCKLIEAKGYSIDFKIKGVYLTSENFSKSDKKYISEILNCPVWGQYGHTESSIFAVQKFHEEQYYCSPLYGFTEVLDENGDQVEIGQVGEIVVTGFIEYGLPFIRYKTGDMAVYGGETKDGETILKQLLGRSVDYIFDKDGNRVYLVGFIFGGHISAFNHIMMWQIHQKEYGKVELLIVKSDGYTDEIEKEIVELFENHGFVVMINYVLSIEKTVRGKQKFLIQDIKL